ncbi:MAG: ABC transporter ATP-binding protein [Phycisphaerae bacterium]
MIKFEVVWSFIRPYKRWFYKAIALTMLCTATSLVPPFLLGMIVDKVIGSRRDDLFFIVMLLFILTPLMGNAIAFFNNYLITLIGHKLVLDTRRRLYQHLLNLPMRFYDKSSTGAIMERLMGDVAQVQQMVTGQTITLASDIVACMVALGFMLCLNWRMALLLTVFIPMYVFNYRFFITRIHKWGEKLREKMETLSAGMQERLSGAMAVKAFGQERSEDRRFTTGAFDAKNSAVKSHYYSIGFGTTANLIYWMGQTGIYLMGCYLVVKNEMTLGSVIAFSSYCVYLLGPAVRFSQMTDQLERAMISVNRIGELLAENPEPPDPQDVVHIEKFKGHVKLQNLCFEYEPGNPVLKNINLDVPAGKTVALVGQTGCGKTTIISLLLRFYRATSGHLVIDDADINQYSHTCLRNNIAMVPQEPVLFEGTVRDNIAYGCPDAPIDRIINAAKVAEIHKTIMGLSQGYDTFLGEEGMKLSVGQKQRLIIARAVLADPAILILDEATSSLDTESEKLLQKALARIMVNRTCFVVAHRLSTIVGADMIVVLSQGNILEVGSHTELLARKDGHYRQLYFTQFTKVA